MYLIPRTIESLKIFLEKRRLLPSVPYFLPLMSAFTWAIIADTHADTKYPMKKTFKQILDFLLGSDQQYQMSAKAAPKRVTFSEPDSISEEEEDNENNQAESSSMKALD